MDEMVLVSTALDSFNELRDERREDRNEGLTSYHFTRFS